MTARLRSERGGILALSAIIIPVFLLLTALVLDVGTWYTHKRSLQNRADAGALAAGVEYLSQLSSCGANPTGPAVTAISGKAKLYAGSTTGDYNETVNKQSEVTVKINASSPTAADNSDGGNPCQDHAVTTPPNPISPNGGIWTDVIVRESNIGTVAGTFGLNMPSITARARVELNQITGVAANGLPFVAETGDQIECVWAQFVRARDINAPPNAPVTTGFTVTPSNPIPLTEGPNNTWTANVANLRFTNAHDDVAIRYWAGSKNGNLPCSFASANKRPLPHVFDPSDADIPGNPVAIDWFNVYDTGASPATNTAPKLRRFALTSDTCGGPGFLYTQSTDPSVECRVGFNAEVDTGPNTVKGQITVQPTQVMGGTGIAPVTVDFDTTGGGAGPNLTTVAGVIRIRPNVTKTGSTYSNDYTQVGATYFSVSWRQTTGRVGTGTQGNCVTGGSNCSGTFQGETVSGVADDIQQSTYMADPLGSTPLVAASVSTATTSYPALGQTGPFTITFTNTAIDKDHIVTLRGSVQGSGNRTRAIYCGNVPGGGAAALQSGIEDGCAKDLVVNQRLDSCAPAPGPSANPWDCVQLEQGNKSSVAKGAEDRFACTPNNWVTGGPLPWDGDPRWAYIILTGFGRTFPAGNGAWLPIEGLLRVYVTGWDQSGGGGGPANCLPNDRPPRGYDGKGAQLWGHYVSPITIDSNVIVADGKCNLTLANIQCKPALVR